jgi:AcrR family transcriptional regulator
MPYAVPLNMFKAMEGHEKGTLSMKQTDTAQRILDTGERLFAQRGFHCTSIRVLSHEAQVNLAAINYHFGSKENLLEAVIERRLVPLNQLQMKKLQTVRETALREERRPKTKDVLLAMIEPTFTFRQSLLENRNFFTLVCRLLSKTEGTSRAIFQKKFKPLFSLLINTLKEALPELPEEVLIWRLFFSIGALAQAMRMFTGEVPVPDKITLVNDAAVVAGLLLGFVTRGINAPLSIYEDP